MKAYTVLSTKKLDPLISATFRQHNIQLIEQEFISVQPIWSEAKQKEILGLAEDGKLYAIFTSAHAVMIVDKYMYVGDTYYVVDWKIFCLSGKTKEAVLQAQYLEKKIVAEANDATALAEKIIHHKIKEVVFFCGDKRRDELPDVLKKEGIAVHEVVMYETRETPHMVLDNIDAVLFFSPSAVQSFFAVNQLSKNEVCFAIGKTTAHTISFFTKNGIVISEASSQEKMLDAVLSYFQIRDL